MDYTIITVIVILVYHHIRTINELKNRITILEEQNKEIEEYLNNLADGIMFYRFR